MIICKEKNFISAVVYVHNNEDGILNFLEKIYGILCENFEKYEIICVNDNSSDESVARIKTFADGVTGSVISVINMSFFQGIELSMNAGVDLAIGDFVFEFDNAYMDYDASTIIQVYNQCLKGFDIVSAAPKSAIKKTSRVFYSLFNSHSNNLYKIRTETFRILSRRAINRVHSISKTIPYRKAVYANCGLKLDTVIYSNTNIKTLVTTKQVDKQRKEMATESLILFTDIAYKISIAMTFLMMISAIFAGAYAIVIFIKQAPIAGWTTTMLFLSFAFFGVFAILAVIIRYLSILVDLVFKKQKYITESIEKLTK